jgi:GAF domain-containing protein
MGWATPQAATTEARLASFTELVAAAIANAEARQELQQLAGEQAALARWPRWSPVGPSRALYSTRSVR